MGLVPPNKAPSPQWSNWKFEPGAAILAEGDHIGHRFGIQQLVPKNSYTLFHKSRKYLSGDVMSFNWVNDFEEEEFHDFM